LIIFSYQNAVSINNKATICNVPTTKGYETSKENFDQLPNSRVLDNTHVDQEKTENKNDDETINYKLEEREAFVQDNDRKNAQNFLMKKGIFLKGQIIITMI
jgi:hypothetical protein